MSDSGQSGDPRVRVTVEVNGEAQTLDVAASVTALEAIRGELGLTGPKLGCGQGACGACTVLVDGEAVCACLLPATSLEGRAVRTIEDLDRDGLHPVQRAFLAEDGLQCGYCTPGFVTEAVAFYDRWRATRPGETPTRGEIAAALAGHLCRCGAYEGIYAAVARACAGDVPEGPGPRHDGLAKVTGRARYTVDVQLPGLLEGRILRSPHAHARVTALDLSAAKALPGVKAVLRLGTKSGLVRYVGQELAAVAAVDRATADRALAAIRIEYEVMMPVVGLEAARQPDAPLVYAARKAAKTAPNASEGPLFPRPWSGNVRGPFWFFSKKAKRARKAVARASERPGWHRVDGTWNTQVQCHCALEPHATVAHWEDDGTLTVYASTQGVWRLAQDIAHRWKLPVERVRVLAEYIGGGFGAKTDLPPELAIAVDLAKLAGAPVRIALDRREELTVGGLRPAQELNLAAATDGTGQLAGLQLEAFGDAGVAIGNVTSALFRIMYPKAPKALVDWDVVTHGPPGRPFRGPGGPPAFWALEQAVDELARVRGEDPVTLRRRWDTSPVRQRLYDVVERLPLWAERGPEAAGDGRYRRGVGLAAAAWYYFLAPSTRVQIDVGPSGVVASVACQDMGNGTRTAIANAVAGVFGLAPDAIEVRIGDSRLPPGPMSGGSRTTASVVPCAEDGAQQLVDHLVGVASSQLGYAGARAAEGGLEHDGGFAPWPDVFEKAGSLSRLGKRRRDKGGYFMPMTVADLKVGKYLSAAVQVTEVEVDTWTGKVRVPRSWVGVGAGRIVSHELALSQVYGGVIQGQSYALYEERRLDPRTGRVLTTSMDDYRIAGIGDIGPIEVHFDEGGFENVVSRAVGIGELVTLAPAASIANAIQHATGWRPLGMPINPARVLAGVGR